MDRYNIDSLCMGTGNTHLFIDVDAERIVGRFDSSKYAGEFLGVNNCVALPNCGFRPVREGDWVIYGFPYEFFVLTDAEFHARGARLIELT